MLNLLSKLIQCQSVTPEDNGAIELLRNFFANIGFECYVLEFSGIKNLYARYGKKYPNICFGGHTDVVPVGDGKWSFNPFGGEEIDGFICGRGAVDMKGGIASFAGAISEYLQENPEPNHSISVIITGNEEGNAIGGTQEILKWMEQKEENIDFCLMCEPTSINLIADAYKLGRRGSVNFILKVSGIQGHIAEQEEPNNSIYKLSLITKELYEKQFDKGNKFFQPTKLQPSTFDTNNPTENLIPESSALRFNIRFNNLHTANEIVKIVETEIRYLSEKYNLTNYNLEHRISGEPFMSEKTEFHTILEDAIKNVTGNKPKINTNGGTSDLRFIKNYCNNNAELGHINTTMHQCDEKVHKNDVIKLAQIYKIWLEKLNSR